MLSSVDLRTDNNVNIFISCTGMLVPKSTLSNKGGIMESPCTQLAAELARRERNRPHPVRPLRPNRKEGRRGGVLGCDLRRRVPSARCIRSDIRLFVYCTA